MVSGDCIKVICSICAVVNCLSLLQGFASFVMSPFPYAIVFNLLDFVTTGISLAADFLLIQTIQSAPLRGQGDAWTGALKTMKLALCMKLLVILLQYFPYLLYMYQLLNHKPFLRKLAALENSTPTWKDYAKGHAPPDFVLISVVWFIASLIYCTATTTVKIVVLYAIHDFYEGVKQQGRFSTKGLLDVYEAAEHQEEAPTDFPPEGGAFMFPGAMVAAGSRAPFGTVAPGGGFTFARPYAPAGPYAMAYQNQPPQMQGSMFPRFYFMNAPGGFQQVAPPAGFQYMAPSAGVQQAAPPDGIRQRQQYIVPHPP